MQWTRRLLRSCTDTFDDSPSDISCTMQPVNHPAGHCFVMDTENKTLRCGVCVLLESDQGISLQLRDDLNLWGIFGGLMEPGEVASIGV